MTTQTKRIVIADPRSFDGDPYEVAERAVLQAEGIAKILAECVDGARLMARNAEMERELARGDSPDAEGFEESAQGRKYAELGVVAGNFISTLGVLAKTASYNPKNRG